MPTKSGKDRKRARKVREKVAKAAPSEATQIMLRGDGKPSTVLQTPADLGLVSRAVRQRWNVPDEHKTNIVRRLDEIVQKRTKTVKLTIGTGKDKREKEVQVESAEIDMNSIAAARVLVAIEGQNQVDDHEYKDRKSLGEVSIKSPEVCTAILDQIAAELGVSGPSSGLVIDATSNSSREHGSTNSEASKSAR